MTEPQAPAQDQSSSSPHNPSGVIGELVQHLGLVFRHMMPGSVVLGGAAISFPHWFPDMTTDLSWPVLTTLAAISVVVGNIAFVLNRYVLDVIIEYALWLLRFPGPIRSGSPFSFVGDAWPFILRSLTSGRVHPSVRSHLQFRASVVFLMWTLAETLFVCANWHSAKSVLSSVPTWLSNTAATVIFLFGVLQIVIVRRLDYQSVADDTFSAIRRGPFV